MPWRVTMTTQRVWVESAAVVKVTSNTAECAVSDSST